MPNYQYFCKSCKRKFDIFYPTISDGQNAGPLIVCPKCGKIEAYKIISDTAFIGEKGKGNW